MEVHFTPEQEAMLAQSAAQRGHDTDQLVHQILARFLDEEFLFAESVRRGEEALDRGQHLTHEQVGKRLDRFLRP